MDGLDKVFPPEKAIDLKGTNRVVFEINNGNDPHGMYWTVLSAEELKIGK